MGDCGALFLIHILIKQKLLNVNVTVSIPGISYVVFITLEETVEVSWVRQDVRKQVSESRRRPTTNIW